MSPDDVLAFWFADGPARYRDAWFDATPEFDAGCAARFGNALRDARSGALDHWAEEPRGALALVVLLDQLSRNIHRGTPDAYAADPQALAVARAALARGFDVGLAPVERLFLYLPFEHAESLAEQEESVRLFEGLRGTYDGAESAIDAAHWHHEVIRRFGRFPHRNAVLGRASTPEEQAFIAEAGSAF
ncbi:MAG: DUF924 domain-containing protein [Acetobacteraceae bacterium]|nr:DUF924 domain-containing protein [Acetobacteraceae bacterium]